jgi:glyoxylase-like metal-dependent hydrolase (beta-lactamase superfamily II)
MVRTETLKYEEVLGLKFGVYRFGRPKLSTYIYYIDGLLIDTGQRRARTEILSQTQNLSIEQIFITHHHEDHSGNIRSLSEAHKCQVYGSGGCSELMKNPPGISFAQLITWGRQEPYPNIIPIHEALKTEKYSFEVIPVPGHAPDMVALYEPEKKWLFSADLYINSFIGYFMDSESVAQQIESTRRILKLDFKVMFCSHNPKLTNAKEQLSKKLSFLESSYENVASLYSKGYSANQIFKELGLTENWYVSALSGGHLSKLNMVKAIIRDIEQNTEGA